MNELSKNLPRDTFIHLLAIITLVVVAVGFGMAVFNYIDFYFPDPVATGYHNGRMLSSYEWPIRQAMAMLIVVFPVFFWVSRFLEKDIDKYPEKRELKIRKWLLYLTLFAAALVMIGDFVTVVNNFLRGELTTHFVLKALTIFFISGSIFYYYLIQLRDRDPVVEISNASCLPADRSAKKSKSHYGARKTVKWPDLFSWIIVMVIIATVGLGFDIIGSPFAQGSKRFDERRVSYLQTIQNYITNYWQNKEKLPTNLRDLEDPLLGVIIPVDPETGGQYEYRIIASLKFELCATFKDEVERARYSAFKVPDPFQDYSWQHNVGRVCFERTIDPDFFSK